MAAATSNSANGGGEQPARPFLICALPRSRTAWLANFLTHGAVSCAHELCCVARAPAQMPFLLRHGAGGSKVRFSGNADTAQAMILPRLLEAMPDAALAVVRRAPEEVVFSLRKLGFPHAEAAIGELAIHLARAAETPGALVLDYEELAKAAAAEALWVHLAPGEPFDRGRWAMLQGFNVQITRARMAAILRQVEERTRPFANDFSAPRVRAAGGAYSQLGTTNL